MNIVCKYVRTVLVVIVLLVSSINIYGSEILFNEKNGLNGLFLQACKEGNLKKVQEFLTAGANLEFNDDGSGLTWAAYYGHPEVVSFLLASRADVNVQDHKGETPLVNALRRMNYGAGKEIWREILKYKPDFDITNDRGDSVLVHALLFRGVKEDDTFLLEDLLAHGIDISRQEEAFGRIIPITKEARIRVLDSHRMQLRNIDAQVIAAHVREALMEITGLDVPQSFIIGQYACHTVWEKYPLPSITEEETKRNMALQAKADAENQD